MAAGRALLGPVIVISALHHWHGSWLALMVVAALVSDIYDGILARRWHCDTPGVRRFDSMADTIFYLGVAAAMWLTKPDVIHADAWWLGALFAVELARHIFDRWKFGKSASYHTYLAKAWGLAMGIGVIAVLGFGVWRPLLTFSLGLGILCDIEGFAMSVVLPQWQHDIKTLPRALALRRQMLSRDAGV